MSEQVPEMSALRKGPAPGVESRNEPNTSAVDEIGFPVRPVPGPLRLIFLRVQLIQVSASEFANGHRSASRQLFDVIVRS
jgi:hypothetical protein